MSRASRRDLGFGKSHASARLTVGRWRKRKGFAEVHLESGEIVRAEIHWYEATGIGKREFKIKRIL
jgi:hypothetical protein